MTDQTPAAVATGIAGPLTVREISPEEELGTLHALGGSFLQTPAWGQAKTGWRRTPLGWFDATGRRSGTCSTLSASAGWR